MERVLKADSFGQVELLLDRATGERRIRRVARGGALPGSGPLARVLLRREARALEVLAGLHGIPVVCSEAAWRGASGAVPAPAQNQVLVRSFVAGLPLHLARELPEDFFDLLERLVREVHARGVCHNDLHKEQNVMVAEDGRPWLIDFQLASCHRRRGASFETRCRDDLRHVQKHLRRYTRDGRGPRSLGTTGAMGAVDGPRLERSATARVWRRTGKPLYNLVTRGLLRTRDGEARRDSAGPWPSWSPALGPRTPESGPTPPG